jgi:hypothetical protein
MASPIGLRKSLGKRLDPYQLKPRVWVGSIGDRDGELYPDASDRKFIWVRDFNGIPHVVFNDRAPVIAGYLVQVGINPQRPSLEEVVGSIPMWNAPVIQHSLPSHSPTQEFPNYDTLWVRGEQFLPWMATPSGMTLIIYPAATATPTGWEWGDPAPIDMTSYVPEHGALVALISVDDDGAYVVTVGDIKMPEVISVADIPAVPVGTQALWAVKLIDSMTTIEGFEGGRYKFIFDLRWGLSKVQLDVMLKSVYDTDGNGVVDEAEYAQDADDSSLRGQAIDPTLAPLDGHGLIWNETAEHYEDGEVGGGAGTVAMVQEDVTAQVDGIVTHFDTANEFVSGTLEVRDNGLLQKIMAITEDLDFLGFEIAYLTQATGTLVTSDGTYGMGYFYGLELANNSGDANNDIDIAVGACRDDADAYNMKRTSVLTKRLDANFAVGNNEGGLDTGSKANSTWYHVFLIRKDSNGAIDALFSASYASPSLPTGWSNRCYLGSVLTNASGNIRPFLQYGKHVLWNDTSLANDVDTTTTTSRATHTLPSIPPGPIVEANLNILVAHASQRPAVYLCSPNAMDLAPTQGGDFPLGTMQVPVTGAGLIQAHFMRLLTDASAQICSRSTATATTIKVATMGWEYIR